MPSLHRSSRLSVLVTVAVLVGGCGGGSSGSTDAVASTATTLTQPSSSTTSASTLPPTTTSTSTTTSTTSTTTTTTLPPASQALIDAVAETGQATIDNLIIDVLGQPSSGETSSTTQLRESGLWSGAALENLVVLNDTHHLWGIWQGLHQYDKDHGWAFSTWVTDGAPGILYLAPQDPEPYGDGQYLSRTLSWYSTAEVEGVLYDLILEETDTGYTIVDFHTSGYVTSDTVRDYEYGYLASDLIIHSEAVQVSSTPGWDIEFTGGTITPPRAPHQCWIDDSFGLILWFEYTVTDPAAETIFPTGWSPAAGSGEPGYGAGIEGAPWVPERDTCRPGAAVYSRTPGVKTLGETGQLAVLIHSVTPEHLQETARFNINFYPFDTPWGVAVDSGYPGAPGSFTINPIGAPTNQCAGNPENPGCYQASLELAGLGSG